jgi:hypothetical protein
MDQQQAIDQPLRRINDCRSACCCPESPPRLQDQEARQRAIGDVGGLQRLPEVHRCRRAVDAHAGLMDCPMRDLGLAVGILDAEVRGARGRIELGQQIQDLADIARRTLAIGGGRQEHAELVELETAAKAAETRR